MRVKSPRRQRHNKILKLAKGYRMTKRKLYRVAHEAVMHAGQYAFAGRRIRRRDLRRLWIVRINAALTRFGVSYSKFINVLNIKKIALDRKILSELAANEPKAFDAVMKAAGFSTKTSK
jgi:large subunit ribosomal protein L20